MHAGLRHDESEEPRKAVLGRSRQPQRRPRQRHGDEAQLHQPVRAAIESGEVGRDIPIPKPNASRLYRAAERARQRHEGRGRQVGKARRRDQTALRRRPQTRDVVSEMASHARIGPGS